jgi:hypothetical protein
LELRSEAPAELDEPSSSRGARQFTRLSGASPRNTWAATRADERRISSFASTLQNAA